MDFVNKLTGGSKEGGAQKPEGQQQQQSGGGFMDKLNGMAGGGKESEKNEDALDKGVDWVQENVMGQGPQNNESAAEQAKDEQISDFIRGQYKNTTGSDVPIKDKERF
ncbi:Uu.00g133430.m01.CDS01 [Anthostomella pinea]|uniref:Uu.00g133430.m01.CDS01 n=1 Tax=Anthostomella pinea TaxID=933095 RepID=A0AAI8YMP9_9PEZI|nr:Uu.00g133430.m01.CDS01 [Anthostomella pinea]